MKQPETLCDTFAAELLVSFHRTDSAAAALVERIDSGMVPGIRLIEDLEQRLASLQLAIRRDATEFRFVRLEVPCGEEDTFANHVQSHYRMTLVEALDQGWMDHKKHHNVLFSPRFQFRIAPHYVMSLLTPTPAATVPLSFSFSATHTSYKQMLGWSAQSGGTPSKRVLIIDSGLSDTTAYNVVDQKNFLTAIPAEQSDVSDDIGHGTAIASIINDLCPGVELVIYKIAQGTNKVSEWDVLAALAARHDADVVNLSLAYGFVNRDCHRCGRISGSSRSTVFETMLDQLTDSLSAPLLVAAAGNEGLDELWFPAKFRHIVAIESIDSARHLSHFTNYSTIGHDNQPHPYVFVMPGGERVKPQPPKEYVGQLSNGRQYWGTSFATAYAVGLIAALWSQPKHSGKDRYQILDHLTLTADQQLPNYQAQTHGHGMLRF